MTLGDTNLGRWRSGISRAIAEAPGPGSSPFVLAEKRTRRPDILSGFKKYQGGWDIVNKHYWAVSVFLFSSRSENIYILLCASDCLSLICSTKFLSNYIDML